MAEIAVVGAGAAGLTAALLLGRSHDVTVFEEADRLGGHAWTIFVEDDTQETPVALDIGFMVFNRRNYPHMIALLEHLGCPPPVESDMSFSYVCPDAGLELCFPDPGRPVDLAAMPSWQRSSDYLRLLVDIVKFGRRCRGDLDDPGAGHLSLGEYLARTGADSKVVEQYVLPSTAAIWSCTPERILDFPAATYLRFMHNHGMLDRADPPRWLCLPGGSQFYTRRIAERLDRVLTGARVTSVRRDGRGLAVDCADGRGGVFDHVVLGLPADRARTVLDGAFEDRREALGRWEYQRNLVTVHRDAAFMPADRTKWASWNLRRDRAGHSSTTYWLNRLQTLPETAQDTFVTLTAPDTPDADMPRGGLFQTVLAHPLYTRDALDSQGRLAELNGLDRLWCCGSYFGDGFHEDAIRSAIEVSVGLGGDIPW